MRILVTGCGYVGSTLCASLLNLGYQVRGVDNFHKGNCDAVIPYCASDDFEFMYGDITNDKHVEKMLDGVDAIVHLAAIVGFPACAKNPALSHLVNVEGTKKLLKYKLDKTPLLFASTGSVYGKIEDVCTEDSPCNPQSEYGRQKLLAEQAVLEAPNTVAYRFATGFGVSPCMRVNLLVNDLTYQAYTNKSLVIFEADARRTFIHVQDMANAFAFGIQRFSSLKHRVYNVGNEANNWSKRKLAEFIKSKTDCLVVYGNVGKDLDQRDYEVSYNRIAAEGWQPHFSVEEGVQEILKVVPLIQIRHQYE
jgi:nucleoside-diphosphate-sugar epimerase